MKKKKIISLLIGGIVSIALTGCQSYTGRRITLFDYENEVGIVRNTQELEVYQEMPMEDGDRVKTGKASRASFNIDNKKRIGVDEETSVQIKSKGSKKNNQTEIFLEQGTIYNEINEKLSGKSSYKVHTNNTTISVHGTIFSVSENLEEIETIINVFEGEVALESPKGDVTAIKGGDTAKVRMDQDGNITIKQEKLSIESLSLFELEAIKEAPKDKEIVFSKEAINSGIEKYSQNQDKEDKDDHVKGDNDEDDDDKDDDDKNEGKHDDDDKDEDQDNDDNKDDDDKDEDQDDDDNKDDDKGDDDNKDDDKGNDDNKDDDKSDDDKKDNNKDNDGVDDNKSKVEINNSKLGDDDEDDDEDDDDDDEEDNEDDDDDNDEDDDDK